MNWVLPAGVVTLLVLPVVQSILADETRGWLPIIARALVRASVRAVPSDAQDRYLEEWLADLDTISDRPLSGLAFALQVRWTAKRLTESLKAPVSQMSEEILEAGSRQFLQDASRPLRLPATNLLTSVEQLAQKLVGEQGDTAHAALRSTRRMSRLLDDLLFLHGTQSTPQLGSADLGKILDAATTEIAPLAVDHEIRVEAETAVVFSVPADLHQLTLNLLRNAVAHTPAGTQIDARTRSIGENAVLVVEDNGPGIPPELQQRVFERFVRGGGDGGRGSGLGLTVVRAVAESHGGYVILEPRRGPNGEAAKGTRVVVRIPVMQRQRAALSLLSGGSDTPAADTDVLIKSEREFIADASHELRTPLTTILANLELLSEELEGEPLELVDAALRTTRQIRQVVGTMLTLARADAKRVQRFRATDLGSILSEASSEVESLDTSHDIHVKAEPTTVMGVRDDLGQLVLNLLRNAVEHTPAGTSVRASTSTIGCNAVLVVEDNGPGLPPQLAPRVFDRFVRGCDRGAGLGLALVQAVAESHGGIATLESAREVESITGARFVIRIPLADDPERNGPDDGRLCPRCGGLLTITDVDTSRTVECDRCGRTSHEVLARRAREIARGRRVTLDVANSCWRHPRWFAVPFVLYVGSLAVGIVGLVIPTTLMAVAGFAVSAILGGGLTCATVVRAAG